MNNDIPMDVEELESSWGWKVEHEDTLERRKQKGKAKADANTLAASAEAERREETLVSPSAVSDLTLMTPFSATPHSLT